MNYINKWTVGLALLISGLLIGAIGWSGSHSWTQIAIAAVLVVVGGWVLIK